MQATIELAGPPIKSVKIVDFYGVPTDVEVPRKGKRFSINGRFRTYYYEVRR